MSPDARGAQMQQRKAAYLLEKAAGDPDIWKRRILAHAVAPKPGMTEALRADPDLSRKAMRTLSDELDTIARARPSEDRQRRKAAMESTIRELRKREEA